MGRQHIENQVIGTRTARQAVWLTAHGANEIHSISVEGKNPAGNSYRQFPEGQVFGFHPQDLISYPLAADAAQLAVAAANVIKVADPLQFTLGDWVELPASVAANATRFRQITAIDYDNSTITLDGAAFSLDAGALIEVDPSRTHDKTTAAIAASNDVPVSDGSRFKIGDVVEIDTLAARTITGIAANVLTVDGAAINIGAGDKNVVSQRKGGYEISNETVDVNFYVFEATNITVPCRPHGRVRESVVVGLTASAKAALQPLIIFDSRLY